MRTGGQQREEVRSRAPWTFNGKYRFYYLSAHAVVCMECGTSSGYTETRKSMRLENCLKLL